MVVAALEAPRRLARLERYHQLFSLAERFGHGNSQLCERVRRQNALLPKESGQDCPDAIMRVVSQESVDSHLLEVEESRYDQSLIGKLFVLAAGLSSVWIQGSNRCHRPWSCSADQGVIIWLIMIASRHGCVAGKRMLEAFADGFLDLLELI